MSCGKSKRKFRLSLLSSPGPEEDKENHTPVLHIHDELKMDSAPAECLSPGMKMEHGANTPIESLIKSKFFRLEDRLAQQKACLPDPSTYGCSPSLSSNEPYKIRRSISMTNPSDCVNVGDSDFTSPISRNSSKRPVAPIFPPAMGQINKKRREDEASSNGTIPLCTKSSSMSSLSTGASSPTIANIMYACSLTDQPNLTADRCCKLSLPTIPGHGKNHDLNNIDCHTLANLIEGCYSHSVRSYRIIDARYEYEFAGGHICGASNFGLWDEPAFFNEFFPTSLLPKKFEPVGEEQQPQQRDILIFHCEFSSSRGPALYRALRKRDRMLNLENYPALHYPECYLLHDGYKGFYASYPNLCDPMAYTPMSHPNFINEERQFHKKSRSWASGGAGTIARTGSSSRLLKL